MATSTPSRTVPILPVILLLAASSSWFVFEQYAIKGYQATGFYDYTIESLSDLSVVYKQVHPLKHHTVFSTRAKTQNFNFTLNGVLFVLAQVALLFSARKDAKAGAARTLRLLLSFLVLAGSVLLAQTHGGPREQKLGTIGWHWTGLALVAVAGNVITILAGAVPNQIGAVDRSSAYRAVSIALGSVGLFSYYRFLTIGTWNFQSKLGLWQRGVIYPVLVWQAFTAVSLLLTSFSTPRKAKSV